MNDQFDNQILQRAKKPEEWLRNAKYLYAAGKAVLQKSSDVFTDIWQENSPWSRLEKMRELDAELWMIHSGVMLQGYAIELIAKGLIVKKGKAKLKLEDKSDSISSIWTEKKKGHDIEWLLQTAEEKINKRERELAKYLTKLTTWAGKYPVPLQPEELGLEWDHGKDEKTLESLFIRLKDKLEA